MEQKGLVVGVELAPSILAPSVEKVPPSVGWIQSNLGEARANCCHQWLAGMTKWEEHATDGPHLHHSPTVGSPQVSFLMCTLEIPQKNCSTSSLLLTLFTFTFEPFLKL